MGHGAPVIVAFRGARFAADGQAAYSGLLGGAALHHCGHVALDFLRKTVGQRCAIGGGGELQAVYAAGAGHILEQPGFHHHAAIGNGRGNHAHMHGGCGDGGLTGAAPGNFKLCAVGGGVAAVFHHKVTEKEVVVKAKALRGFAQRRVAQVQGDEGKGIVTA